MPNGSGIQRYVEWMDFYYPKHTSTQEIVDKAKVIGRKIYKTLTRELHFIPRYAGQRAIDHKLRNVSPSDQYTIYKSDESIPLNQRQDILTQFIRDTSQEFEEENPRERYQHHIVYKKASEKWIRYRIGMPVKTVEEFKQEQFEQDMTDIRHRITEKDTALNDILLVLEHQYGQKYANLRN